MKVVHIHRPARSGGYSIETIFKTIAVEMRNLGISVTDYELRTSLRLPEDFVNLRRLDADIYHVTGDVNYWIAMLPKGKTVLTIHDVGHYLFGLAGWRKALYRWFWLTMPIRLASRVTVVSDATKRDLKTYLGVALESTDVVENCYSSAFFPRIKQFNKKCPRILQIGTGKNKNVLRLIQALEGITCGLVLIGRMNADILASLHSVGIPYENYVDISQDEMAEQYALADLVSFVSTSEGFGMPIIEAQVMSKALITANLPPMSMVAGPEACLVDPLSVDSIRTGIVNLIEDEAYRARTIAFGLRNVDRFSVSKVANRYLEIYRSLVPPI